jgi:ferric-dicitrate binding protein FerR (iron transport regulator)
MTEQEIPDHSVSTNELTIVQIVLGQLTLVESRLGRKMDENARAAEGRWRTHDEEHREQAQINAGFDTRLKIIEKKDERESIIHNARIGPVKKAGVIAIREWRAIAMVLGFIATWLGMAELAGAGK